MEVEICNQTHKCLLDTGCDHSIISWKLVPTATLEPAPVNVTAANGSEINVLGHMTINFSIKEKALQADLLVADDFDEFMLGFDWLTAQRARWDLNAKNLTLHGRTIPLCTRPSRVGIRRVYVKERVEIPANTEQNVPIKLVRSTWRTTAPSDWVVHPKQTTDTARVLIPGETQHAAVRVVNLSENTINLPAETDLGTAEFATILPDKADTVSKSLWSKATGGMTYEHIQSVVESLPSELSVEERLEAVELLHQYQDVFSRHEYDLGRTTLMEHRMDTADARPIKLGLRRQPQTSHTIIDEFTSNMEKQGIIEKSASPWASIVVVVTKHYGTPRITLDYRMLNNVTYKDSYPPPNIADCLDAFKGSSWFGILDLRSSFYQVPLAEVDRDKTAFITRRGQCRFCSLPMGLSNSPATFSASWTWS